MQKANEAADFLSIFDSHIHPVLGIDRESTQVIYVNAKANELFDIQKRKKVGTLSNVIPDVKLSGIDEKIVYKKAKYKLSRLESNQFKSLLLFFEPIEDEPGKKVLETGELAASLVAHLFRSPLTALIGLAEMVSSATELNREMISKALSDGLERMGGFVDKLDEFSQSIKPSIDEAHLPSIVQATLSKLNPKERQKVKVEIEKDIKSIQTDGQLVQAILSELLKNAFEFGLDDLAQITIQVFNSTTVRVGNTGVISKEIEESLFQPFYSSKSQNWGLGLSKSVKQVQSLGGSLRVIENSRIHGIVFELNLNQETN